MPKKTDKHYDKHLNKVNRQKRIKNERKGKQIQRDPQYVLHEVASPIVIEEDDDMDLDNSDFD